MKTIKEVAKQRDRLNDMINAQIDALNLSPDSIIPNRILNRLVAIHKAATNLMLIAMHSN